MSWKILQDQQPELAAFGVERLNGRVAYLATVRRDGSPRVHPMTPIIGQGHLFVFMEPTSPKGHDLQRDGRYAIHCSMSDTSGASGEFVVTGQAHVIDNPELRALAVSLASYAPEDRYILFEFDVESAASTIYPDERPVRRFWKRDKQLCSNSRQTKSDLAEPSRRYWARYFLQGVRNHDALSTPGNYCGRRALPTDFNG